MALDHPALAGDGPLNAQYTNAQYRGSGLPLPRFATLKADELPFFAAIYRDSPNLYSSARVRRKSNPSAIG